MRRMLARVVANLVRLEPVDLVLTAVAAAVYLPVFGVARALGRRPAAGGFRRARASAGPRRERHEASP